LAAWVAGRPDDVVRAVDEVWDLAVAHPRPWILGELSWWRHVAGARHETAAPIARPYRLMIDGALAAAAEEWAAVGAPLWEAICRALDDDPALALRGLQLADAVDAPAVRQALLRERHARGMSVPRGPRAATRANAYGLTGRELDVLSLVGEGLTNAEVAERLFLSEKTVAHHVSAALRKTGEPTRARAAAAVRRAGHDEAADRRAGET
jgi:DNA-binding CsgD family transcriptional regulator